MLFDSRGNVLFRESSGASNYVKFSKEQLSKMKGATLTHNHPSSSRGKLRFALVINEDIDYNVVKKKIQRRYDKGRFAGKSIEDYIAHEMAHIMTYQDCKNEAEFRTRQRIVERQFMQGISQYADKTGKGEESLAEAFVRYRNKEKIPIRAELLIRSYIERWKK